MFPNEHMFIKTCVDLDTHAAFKPGPVSKTIGELYVLMVLFWVVKKTNIVIPIFLNFCQNVAKK